MKVRAYFNSKRIENEMVNAGLTATDLWKAINKKHPAILYDAVVRVVSGRSNKQSIVKAIADELGGTVEDYRISRKVNIRPDGRAGVRRKLREK